MLAILGRLFGAPVFALLGARGEVLHLVIRYMDIWFLGLPLFALSMIGTSLVRAVGNAAIPGVVMTVGSVLQVLIEPLLIFGLGPFPKMGIEGAAMGFVIARAVSFALCYYVIVVQERLLTTTLGGIIGSLRSIMHVGAPVVAGFGVGSRIGSLMVMIVMAVASTSGPFIGQNWGARKYERVNTALSIANKFAMAWGVAAFVLMLLLGKWLVSLINDDPTVVETANWYLVITPLSIGFMGMTAIASSCFNAMGQPIPPLVISIARMFVVYVPMAILFDYWWGYVGIFVATSLSSMLLGIVAWFWNRHAIVVSRSRQSLQEAVV
jgi:Na+-driven multidrug efflux pump